MIQQSHSWAYVHTENMNTLIQKDTCKKKKRYMHLSVHTSTIYNSQDMKQPKCPSTDY